MKKIVFAIAIIMILSLSANAQTDGFFNNWGDGSGDRTMGGSPQIAMPQTTIGTPENTTAAPLGSGLLVLTALGAGYAIARKRR